MAKVEKIQKMRAGYGNYDDGGKWEMFNSGFMKKTVKELRKNQYFTAKELADKLHIDTIDVLNMDDKRLKDIDEPLRSQLLPVLRGDYVDKIPWL